PLHEHDVAGAKRHEADMTAERLVARDASAMDRERQEPGPLREACALQARAVQHRAARDDDLGELLLLGRRRGALFRARSFVQCRAVLLLERFDPLRRISEDESVPRLNAYARQLRDDEPFVALDAIDAHLVARERETFGERFSARDAAL